MVNPRTLASSSANLDYSSAFLQLEPLGIQFENNLDSAGILSIDGQGGKNGTLSIGYAPCTVNGETDEELLPEEFMVDSADELIGMKNLYFKVFIKSAKGLPKQLCCNPFVSYQFKFEKDQVYTTPEVQGIQTDPDFAYENLHRIDTITPEIAQELKDGSISFMCYAYPPARDKMKQMGNDQTLAQKKAEEQSKLAELEARVLGLTMSQVVTSIGQSVNPAKVKELAQSRMMRKKTLEESGKLKQGQEVDVEGNKLAEGDQMGTYNNVGVVEKKEGAACCLMF